MKLLFNIAVRGLCVLVAAIWLQTGASTAADNWRAWRNPVFRYYDLFPQHHHVFYDADSSRILEVSKMSGGAFLIGLGILALFLAIAPASSTARRAVNTKK